MACRSNLVVTQICAARSNAALSLLSPLTESSPPRKNEEYRIYDCYKTCFTQQAVLSSKVLFTVSSNDFFFSEINDYRHDKGGNNFYRFLSHSFRSSTSRVTSLYVIYWRSKINYRYIFKIKPVTINTNLRRYRVYTRLVGNKFFFFPTWDTKSLSRRI
jgi:hypothetical protein